MRPPPLVEFRAPWPTPSLKGQGMWHQRSHAPRTAKLRGDTKLQLMSASIIRPAPPWRLTVTRGNESAAREPERRMDGHDNLRLAVSAIVDGAADYLGVSDNDPRLTIEYAQTEAPPGAPWVGVRIETRLPARDELAALRTRCAELEARNARLEAFAATARALRDAERARVDAVLRGLDGTDQDQWDEWHAAQDAYKAALSALDAKGGE